MGESEETAGFHDEHIIEGERILERVEKYGLVGDYSPVNIRNIVPQHPPHREQVAKGLTYTLVWALLISFALHYALTGWLSINGFSIEAISSAFDVWLPVISGFVGSAVTYYLTEREREKR